jgi:biotin carboxyl carrier protein
MMQLESKPPTRNGHAQPAARTAASRGARRFPRPVLLVAAALIAAAARVVAFRLGPARPAAQGPPAETALTPKLVARGQVRPIGQARVGTLVGGVVYQLSVDVGDRVTEQQEIARVRGANGAEVLTPPGGGRLPGSRSTSGTPSCPARPWPRSAT